MLFTVIRWRAVIDRGNDALASLWLGLDFGRSLAFGRIRLEGRGGEGQREGRRGQGPGPLGAFDLDASLSSSP